MFIKNLNKASFFIVVPFFIFSFNNEINAQVKYVFHNKANLKLNRKYSIPRIAKKSVQTLKSNIIKSNSTNNIKLSGVKIINNKDFKNELSNISSKIGSPTKVETTTISGVEIILGSSNYLANNNKSSNKIRKTVQNKVVRPSTKATVRYNPSTNYIDNEDLFKDSPWEENNETTTEEIAPEPINEIVQEEVDHFETTEEEIESIEETVLEETTTEEVAPEPFEENTTNEVENLRFKVSESAKIENDLAEKANLYYTVRVKSVSNPADGLKFLMEIKDNDAVWDEHTFHLFKDQENENITNISLGKFVNKQKAENLMEYLKTKNIKNPSIEKYENKIAPKISNKVPNKKPVSTIRSSSEIETPINKVVKNPETKKEISSNKNLLDNISSKVDETENYFSVQVGANDKISSTNIQGLNLNKEKLFFVNIEKGKYAINYGKHNDYGSAHKIALEIHKKGLQTAFVTKYENGVRVKISKKDYLTDKTPKKTISDDINQLGYLPVGPNDKGKFVQIGTIYNWNAHNFKPLYDQLERTIYYKIKENNSLIFLVGPLQESEVFIELRTIKQIISDAFIKTL